MKKNYLRRYSSGITKLHRSLDIAICTYIYIHGLIGQQNIILYIILLYLIISTCLVRFYQSFRTMPISKISIKIVTRSIFFIFCIYIINCSPILSPDFYYHNSLDFLIRSSTVFAYLIASHLLTRSLIRFYRIKGGNSRTILLWGGSNLLAKVKKEINDYPWMGLNLVAWYSPFEKDINNKDLNCNGGLVELEKWIMKNNVDQIIFSDEGMNRDISKLIDIFGNTPLPVTYLPSWFNSTMSIDSKYFGASKVISIWDNNQSIISLFIKRLADIVASVILIVLLSPLLILISILITLSTGQGFLYIQKRYGINGNPFKIYKFRTMKVSDTGEEVYLKQALKNDSRVTKLGSILRSLSIDELPQIFNVLKGDMSIVGPRPHAISHNEYYRTKINAYMQRHSLKPGITGLAQVSGLRGETKTIEDMKNRIEADLKYINNFSLLLDLKILLKTFYGIWLNKGY